MLLLIKLNIYGLLSYAQLGLNISLYINIRIQIPFLLLVVTTTPPQSVK